MPPDAARAAPLPLDLAQARLLAGVEPLPAEHAPLADAAGRILAADVRARLTQPPFDASAMDGYAVRWVDGPGPWRVVGEAAAGRAFTGKVGAGEAARIFTGAPLPAGADTVVVQEEVARDGEAARLTGEGPSGRGAHVRPCGLDFAAGGVVAAARDRLSPARVGLLAAAGHAAAPVHRRPRVALIATGDELAPPGATPGPAGIVSSNGVMLAALLREVGAVPRDLGIAPDRPEALAAMLRDGADADLLVTIGGASVGDHDLVLPTLEALGGEVDFWRVAIKPGKPLLAGRLGGARVLGLPGNPVSAFVCALLFLLPMVRALAGERHPLPSTGTARLGAPLPANGPRRDHLRAALRDGVATPAAVQDSAMLSVLAAADALIIRPAHAKRAEVDEIVEVLPLRLPFSS